MLTNCALLGLTSTQLRDNLGPTIGGSGIAIILFIYEQGVLFFSYWLRKTVPKVPLSVQNAQARERKSLEKADTLLMNATLSRKASSLPIQKTEDYQTDTSNRMNKKDDNSNSNSNSNSTEGDEAKWGDTVASLIPNDPGSRFLLGNKSRSMVIASRRAFAEQRSASDYALLSRTDRDWGLQKRVTFDSVPRFFSADTQQYRRGGGPQPSNISYPQTDTLTTFNTEDPERDLESIDYYTCHNDQCETFVEGDYISASDEEDSDASSDGMRISPALGQLGYIYSPKTDVPSMNPWDMRFSPEDARQSGGSAVGQYPSPPLEAPTVGQSSPPRSPMVRENSSSVAKESSLHRCDSPKNFAIQKLEEVLESLKQQQVPPFIGGQQNTTSPAVPANSSPARKPWFFRNNNKDEESTDIAAPAAATPSRRQLTPTVFMGGSAMKPKKKTNNILDSIAPLGQQLAHPSPSHPNSKRDGEVKYQTQKQGRGHHVSEPQSFASEPKSDRKVPRAIPKQPRYPAPAVPEFANASMDISMYDDEAPKKYRGSSFGAQSAAAKKGKGATVRNDPAVFQSLRKSNADDKIIRWTQKLTNAKNNLLRAMDRAQSPFSYVLEHKEQPSPPYYSQQSQTPPSQKQKQKQQQQQTRQQYVTPQQSHVLPRKLSNSPADLSGRRPHRAQDLPQSSLTQHRPPAPQPSSSAVNAKAGIQSSFLDPRPASPNPHLRHHPQQMPNLVKGEHKAVKKRNEPTESNKTPPNAENPFAFANN